MKNTVLLLIVLLGVVKGSPWCDVSVPRTAAHNEYFLGTLTEEGKIWQQDVRVITPSNDPAIMNVQSYSFWQHNFNNVERCAITSIELNPRITADGQLALAIQEIDAHLNRPCMTKCPVTSLSSSSDSEDSGDDSSSSSHSRRREHTECTRTNEVNWVTPYTAESLFVLGKTAHNRIFYDSVQTSIWEDPVTGSTALMEALYTVVPHQHRLYSLSVPVEFVPGQPESTDFGALINFNSNAVEPPAFVAAALQAYQAGEVGLDVDPNSPDGYPVQVYLYIVPQATRDTIDMEFFRKQAKM